MFDNEVHYNGTPITGYAIEKLLGFLKDGLPIEPLVKFLDNLYKNTDQNVRERLYKFLEKNNLAITERGSFLAFKLVKEDGTPPYHGGQIQNEKGEWIPAKYEVGKTYLYDKSRIVKTTGECSTEGIYVGNKTYWGNQFNEKEEYTGTGLMLIAEIFPQDVENVPHADATKLVVSKMKVVDAYKSLREKVTKTLWEETPKSTSTPKTQPKRDANGRFISNNTPKHGDWMEYIEGADSAVKVKSVCGDKVEFYGYLSTWPLSEYRITKNQALINKGVAYLEKMGINFGSTKRDANGRFASVKQQSNSSKFKVGDWVINESGTSGFGNFAIKIKRIENSYLHFWGWEGNWPMSLYKLANETQIKNGKLHYRYVGAKNQKRDSGGRFVAKKTSKQPSKMLKRDKFGRFKARQ